MKQRRVGVGRLVPKHVDVAQFLPKIAAGKTAQAEKFGAFARPALHQIVRQLRAVAVGVAFRNHRASAARSIANAASSARCISRKISRVVMISSASRSRLRASGAFNAISFKAWMP